MAIVPLTGAAAVRAAVRAQLQGDTMPDTPPSNCLACDKCCTQKRPRCRFRVAWRHLLAAPSETAVATILGVADDNGVPEACMAQLRSWGAEQAVVPTAPGEPAKDHLDQPASPPRITCRRTTRSRQR